MKTFGRRLVRGAVDTRACSDDAGRARVVCEDAYTCDQTTHACLVVLSMYFFSDGKLTDSSQPGVSYLDIFTRQPELYVRRQET